MQPTIFDNFEVKISAFDYAFFSYSISYSDNNIAQQVGRKDLLITNTNINIPKMRIHSFNAGIPVPFMVFTKSLKEMLKFDFNPDKINFLYLYTNYQKHEIPDLDNKDSFEVSHPGAGETFPVYVSRKSETGKDLANKLPWNNDLPAIVELLWHKQGSQEWVELRSLVANGWKL